MNSIGSVRVSLNQVYKFKDLNNILKIKTKKKSLYEILMMYPNKGINFKVWKKNWSIDKYFIITHIDSENSKKEIWGNFYQNNIKAKESPVKLIQSLNKTLWNYSIEETNAVTDNNVFYNNNDLLLFKQKKFPNNKLIE